ncbi:hypothetical protein, partial [Kushneria phosphatilytica]|uniref:hypothetical protein n=1 Tax=Kushneria phosphatilytica TaxID=657387 RepID=UPI001981E94E
GVCQVGRRGVEYASAGNGQGNSHPGRQLQTADSIEVFANRSVVPRSLASAASTEIGIDISVAVSRMLTLSQTAQATAGTLFNKSIR